MYTLPLTYDECRERFRRSAAVAGRPTDAHLVDALGPHGQDLTVDTAWIGSGRPERALVVLSGTHGVEGFVGSALQCEWFRRLPTALPADMAVLVVHAVNPWGMAWWRRQNESNVDLNRNWRRDHVEPLHNDVYDELHDLACPDTATLPDPAPMVDAALALVAAHGMEWVRNGISNGQYRHPDGLHYGGTRTEASNRILEQLIRDRLDGVERLLTVDLHTGHGPRGVLTLLADSPPGSPSVRFLERLGVGPVEATVANPDATTGTKSGQIANGLGDLLPGVVTHATSAEFGTASDEEQLIATFAEQWVHRLGDRNDPEHATAIWNYRCCFTPDDPEWVSDSLSSGAELLDAALGAVCDWDRTDLR